MAAAGADQPAGRRPSSPTSAVAPTTTAAPLAAVVETTITTAVPVPETPTTVAPTTGTTAPLVEHAPIVEPPTTVPPAPTYSDTPSSLRAGGYPEVFHSRGDGCTGPGHVANEYGVVGIIELADGQTLTGDRVPVAPGGVWESTFFVGNPGTHLHRVQCTLLDGTVLFEYAPQPFTIVP